MYKIEKIKNSFYIDEKTFNSISHKGYGVETGKGIYELNIYECLFLIEKKKAELNSKSKKIEFKEIISYKNFDITSYIIYKDLRTKGYIVKSGFKYGFAFRVYDKGIKPNEDHSLWLVEPIREKDSLKMKSIAGSNRVAHGTGKKMLFGIVDDENNVTYIETNWKRV